MHNHLPLGFESRDNGRTTKGATMHITRLRLVGFKSFVEPTDLVVEPGLTGVVGPNGCGKSNLLEALRWVMGETSHKSMRAAAMDDVIFAGTTTRPPRNVAEVTIHLDNRARRAPVEFNGSDEIEITRRIEREAGSAYRINGVEARARDVKILFEDAATGARSPALVRQGQIGELVNAKPENRRRILEDAAGVAGLHSRRHEAELRLKQTEANLQRMNDIRGALVAQLDSLKRQARQARRYRDLSADLRRAEALAFHVAWRESHAEVEREEAALREVLAALAAATAAEVAALSREAELASVIAPLREEEAARAAALARIELTVETFEQEAKRAADRERELKSRRVELAADIAREEDMVAEAAATLARLAAEQAGLDAGDDGDEAAETAARDRLAAGEATLRSAEAALQAATTRAAEARAERRRLDMSKADREEAVAKLKRQIERITAELRDVTRRPADAARLAELTARADDLATRAANLETAAAAAEAAVAADAPALAEARAAAAAAQLAAQALATERQTLAKLLVPPNPDGLPRVVDHVTVAAGYEAALAAALGEDLDAALDAAGSVHWVHVDPPEATPDAPLPVGAAPLLPQVTAPPALARRLAQVGVVGSRDDGQRLQAVLRPGQRLVTVAGDLWRWDGFVATADGRTAAAVRLAERTRLDDLDRRADAVAADAAAKATAAADLARRVADAEARERSARTEWRQVQYDLARCREAVVAMERSTHEADARRETLTDQKAAAEDDLLAATERLDELALTLDHVDDADGLAGTIATADLAAQRARAAVAEARAAATDLVRARQQRRERLATLRSDTERWRQRQAAATAQLAQLRTRATEIAAGLAEIADLPGKLAEQRRKLSEEVARVAQERAEAADRFAAADAALDAAVRAVKAAQAEIGHRREARAGIDARLDAARARRADDVRRAREALEVTPEACLEIAGVDPSVDRATLPGRAAAEARVATLKSDRDRLGGVNLEAEAELARIEGDIGGMASEIADVEQGIAKLRGAIGQLNREAKQRLGEAFRTVDGHFQRLFTTLFGGGEARLELVQGDDPLEGGLEIVAKPPGKKPATLSLLSGGEQTLTALSLIFAVFLTNPSPICVLDEVDAPLDDANVDRFCTLMEKMASETDTRFLVITHHPMTMARMSRLFGVTMAEKGVSQLVSVDLQTAVRFQEAV
jgi:chromosome segregation protein